MVIPQAKALGKHLAEGLRVSAAGGNCSQQPHSVGEARCLLSTQAMMSLDSTGALPSFLPPLSPPLLFIKTFQTADESPHCTPIYTELCIGTAVNSRRPTQSTLLASNCSNSSGFYKFILKSCGAGPSHKRYNRHRYECGHRPQLMGGP